MVVGGGGGALQQGYYWLKDRLVGTDDYVLIMNDDTVFSPDFIQNGIDIIKGKSRSFLVARSYSKITEQLINLGTFYFDFKKGIFLQTHDLKVVNCTNTRGLLIKVNDFLSIGGFRPKLLPHYLSDIEFTHRAIKKGVTPIPNSSYKLIVDEQLTGYHSDKSKTFISKIKVLFSKKYSGNPIYMSIFFMLVCPWKWKFINIFRIYLRPINNFLKYVSTY
jgi:GT2 family glycosyltransferase